MCYKKVACFYDNKFSTSNLLSGITCGNIDTTIIKQQKRYAVGQSYYLPKIYLIKNRFLAIILQNDMPRRSLFYLYNVKLQT